jgi:HK97 family phage major capsid protein
MSATTIKSLMEQRKDLFAQANDVAKREKQDGKYLAADERERVDKLLKDIDDLDKEIDMREKLLDAEKRMAQKDLTDKEKRDQDKPEAPAEYREVFTKWFNKEGTGEILTQEERSILRAGEKRAQTTQTTTSGGFLIPEGFSGELEKTMALYGGMLDAARIWRTPTGNLIPWPTVNDTSNVAVLIAENTQESEQDVVFAEVQFNAYKYTSKLIRVPYELLQDSYFNMPSLLADLLGERLGRGTNLAFTTADGSAKPKGVVAASTSGVTAAAVAAVTHAELIALKHSVDPAYRGGPKAGFMFNDSTLSALKQLSIGSSDARPLWQPGMAQGEPNTIDGSRYWINQDVADLAASSKSVLYGDFNKFVIRISDGIRLSQSEHLYMDYDQTAFVAHMRVDSDLIASGAIKFITQAAS